MGKKLRDPLKIRVNWRHRSILIVDDVTANFEILKAALEPTHAKIEHARTGLEGIRICLENKRIDLVLMDINLPGINGYHATRELKVLKPEIAVIGHSAFISSATNKDLLESGMDDFFIKPINPAELIALIRSTLIKFDKRI
jgi:CheY-like chemotaxis protein